MPCCGARHKTVRSGIQYVRKGNCVETYCRATGQGQPIVYLHGWGCDGGIFQAVAERLPDYGNYLIDFAGFGNSAPPPEQGWDVFDYARQLIDFMTEKGLSNVTIVAHSFGCRVAMIAASTRPDLVNRALLFAPAGLRRFSFVRWCKVRYYKLCKKLNPARAKRFASDDYLNVSPALKNTFVKVINRDLSAYARQMRCKTLIVAAVKDTAVPIRAAKRVHKLVKNSDFVTVEGDHFALFYTPQSFAQIVRLFVEE